MQFFVNSNGIVRFVWCITRMLKPWGSPAASAINALSPLLASGHCFPRAIFHGELWQWPGVAVSAAGTAPGSDHVLSRPLLGFRHHHQQQLSPSSSSVSTVTTPSCLIPDYRVSVSGCMDLKSSSGHLFDIFYQVTRAWVWLSHYCTHSMKALKELSSHEGNKDAKKGYTELQERFFFFLLLYVWVKHGGKAAALFICMWSCGAPFNPLTSLTHNH